MKPNDPEFLEQRLHRTLRSLPNRQAPVSLTERVLAEIARKEALPWWRRSQTAWPIAARAAFVLASLGVVAALTKGATALDTAGAGASLVRAISGRFGRLAELRALVDALTGAGEALVDTVSPIWLYGGLAVVAAWYAMVVGLGAAIYRTLSQSARTP